MASQRDIPHVIAATFQSVGKALQDLGAPYGWKPTDDSLATQEANAATSTWSRQQKREFRGPIDLLSALVFSRVVVAGDYLRSIATLAANSDERVRLDFAAQATGRATLEALAYVYWLVQPDIGHSERIRRLVIETVEELHMKKATSSRLTTIDVDLSEDARAVRRLAQLNDVPMHEDRPTSEGSHALPKVKGPKRPAAIDIIQPLMPSTDHPELGAVVYYLLSNAAHASAQGILGAAAVGADASGSLHIELDRQEVLRGVVPTLWSVPAPTDAVLRYFGWDSTAFHDTFAKAATALSEGAAARG